MNAKTKLFLPLALAFPMFTSCGEAVDAASNAGDAAASAAGDLADKAGDLMSSLKDIDVSSLGVDKIKDMAGQATGAITEKLGAIKDVDAAQAFKDNMGPVIDKLVAMKDKLGAALPGTEGLKNAITNFSGDGKIMEILQPIMDKLKSLVG